MTAMTVTASVTGSQRVFWHPSAALQVAHKPIRNRRLAASLLAAVCALTFLLGLAGPASASTAPDSETAVAAKTDPATASVGLQTPETQATVGPNGLFGYDGVLGCCVAPGSAGLVYPPNRGFYGDPIDVTQDRGVVIDRHGSRYGTFVSPEGTPFPQRSLPQSSLDAPYEAFEVVRPIPGARAGVVEPWFDQPGWGVQYELPASVQSLIDDGYLVPVKP